MPMYDFECPNRKCKKIFEEFNPPEKRDIKRKCPKCGTISKKIVSFRNKGPSFTERLYSNGGFYHQGIGEVVNSERHLQARCKELGFSSKHEGAQMNHKQERMLLSKRTQANPREIREKVKWSGKGANLPTLDVYSKDE